MNLLQKIYSKLEKKVNEVLMTRKFNAFIESKLVEKEEDKEEQMNIIKSKLETGNFDDACRHFIWYLEFDREIEHIKAFKDFVLSEKDNTKN